MKCMTFVTGRVHARPAIPHVLELAASGKLQPEQVTTRVVDWDDAAAALARARLGEARLQSQSSFERVCRPAEPLLCTALRDVPNGFWSQRPSWPGALPAARWPTLSGLSPPRSRYRDMRGARIATRNSEHAESDDACNQHVVLAYPAFPARTTHRAVSAAAASGCAARSARGRGRCRTAERTRVSLSKVRRSNSPSQRRSHESITVAAGDAAAEASRARAGGRRRLASPAPRPGRSRRPRPARPPRRPPRGSGRSSGSPPRSGPAAGTRRPEQRYEYRSTWPKNSWWSVTDSQPPGVARHAVPPFGRALGDRLPALGQVAA